MSHLSPVLVAAAGLRVVLRGAHQHQRLQQPALGVCGEAVLARGELHQPHQARAGQHRLALLLGTSLLRTRNF